MASNRKYHFFWRKDSICSRWYPSKYVLDGHQYSSAEQGVMHGKALLFKDGEVAQKVLQTNDALMLKSLGRQVRGFLDSVWVKNREDIVYRNNMAKFMQAENFQLLEKLLSTKGLLVEASPQDRVWGIGMTEEEARRVPESQWIGTNLLGKILTRVREDIRSKQLALIEKNHPGRRDIDRSIQKAVPGRKRNAMQTAPKQKELTKKKIVRGDLLDLATKGEFDVIVHGCNCYNTMGAGIAKLIKSRWPAVYKADCATQKGSRDKLGTYTKAVVRVNGRTGDHRLCVVNAYTQHHWNHGIARDGDGGKRRCVDYDAVQSVFQKIKHDFAGKRIAYPMIGAGLAGGDWKIISSIIETELGGEDHTFVKYAAPKPVGSRRRPTRGSKKSKPVK